MKAGRGSVTLTKNIHPQTHIVMDAVKNLPPRQAALVITHGRKLTRPDELRGLEPRLRPVWRRPEIRQPRIQGKDRNGHYGFCVLEWEISPATIADAREAGRLWREAVAKLERELDGLTINGWLIESAERRVA